MPNEVDEFDESDTTAEEFDAMWDEATPVETVGPDPVVARGQNFWLVDLTLMPAIYTNEGDDDVPLRAPRIVPDTTVSAAGSASSYVPQPA
ncbi:hypothetical protein O971_05815 [Mycobacterium avium subsp. hominissuis 10-4249]|nr:hypothetical protein O971_05815 [Mycobacterium avium subsp. hominissuis 10-4249]KDO94875.1 hypothetical protein MAVA5_15410 [Mycobacterium avium subsp. hominissuis A5]